MSQKFLTNIDLNKNQLLNGVIQVLATAPANPALGQIYYNSADKLMYQFDGASWKPVGKLVTYDLTLGALSDNAVPIQLVNSETPGSPDIIYIEGVDGITITKESNTIKIQADEEIDTTYTFSGVMDTVNEVYKITITPSTGTPTVISIPADYAKNTITVNGYDLKSNVTLTASDINAESGDTIEEELAKKLDKSGGTMSGAINMGGNKITNIADATVNTDVVNFKQLQDAISGLGTVFNLKGTKATIDDLPSTGNKIGDVWYVQSEHAGFIWINRGTEQTPDIGWEEFGPVIDLSGYLQIANLAKSTGQNENTAMTQKATTDALALKADKTELTPIYYEVVTLGTSATTASISVDGDIVNIEVSDSVTGEVVIADIVYTSDSAATVRVAVAPTNALNIKVLYTE